DGGFLLRPCPPPLAASRRPGLSRKRVSLILDFAWSAFSTNRLSWREPATLPLRVIRIRPSPSSRRPQDKWRRTIALVRSERGSCIVCPGTPRAKFGFKSAAEQCAVTRERNGSRRISPSCQSFRGSRKLAPTARRTPVVRSLLRWKREDWG